MLKKYINLIVIFLLVNSEIKAQSIGGNDTAILNRKTVDFITTNYQLGSYYQSNYTDNLPEILLPDFLNERRKGTYNYQNLQKLWGLNNSNATDNPLFHGAMYFKADTKIRIAKKIQLNIALIAEHRGASYGTFTTKNIIIFPKINFNFHKNISLFNDSFDVNYTIGNIDNCKSEQGLTIYNIDIIGEKLKLEYNHFYLSYLHISDLLSGPGLNIDDSYHFFYGYNKFLKNKDSLFFSLGYIYNTSVTDYLPYSLKPKNTVDFSSGLKIKNIMFYSQLSYRTSYPLKYYKNNYACLVGINYFYNSIKINIQSTLEGRYYGWLYNSFFINRDVYYRDTNSAATANTIGPQLYPLYAYERPFSQWAVYTEYRYKSVFAISSVSYLKLFITNALWLNLNTDINLIKASEESVFVYPFFKFGLDFIPIKGCNLFVGVSNKGMNLDNHYQTFYLYKIPVVHFEMKINL